jgi:hypothetical protein
MNGRDAHRRGNDGTACCLNKGYELRGDAAMHRRLLATQEGGGRCF